jgi:hypothetical protein
VSGWRDLGAGPIKFETFNEITIYDSVQYSFNQVELTGDVLIHFYFILQICGKLLRLHMYVHMYVSIQPITDHSELLKQNQNGWYQWSLICPQGQILIPRSEVDPQG